jgi:hypothetical protein
MGNRQLVTGACGVGLALGFVPAPMAVGAAEVGGHARVTAPAAPLGVAVLGGFLGALSGLATDVVDFFIPPQPVHVDVQLPPNPIAPSGGWFDFSLIPPSPLLLFAPGDSFDVLLTPPTFGCSLNLGFDVVLHPPNPCTPPPPTTSSGT